MKSMEQLEKAYQREVELAEKQKRTATDIKKQIDERQGKLNTQNINALNLSGEEYDRFIRLIGSSKKTVLEVADQVLGGQKRPEKGDEKGHEESW